MSKPSKTRPFVYGAVKSILFVLYKFFFNFKYFGSEKVPLDMERGLILAPNHESFLDPPMLAMSLKRRVTYLAKEYLFRAFFVGWLLRSIGAFPIKTKADDFRSIRELIKILKLGHCLVVFPEGTRSHDGNMKEAEAGVGFLAIKSEAAVVPVYIDGSFEAFPKGAKFFKFWPIRVYYGTPFIPAKDEGIMASQDPYMVVGQRIMAEIKKLAEEAKQN